jgi:hypothetical protein
MKEPLAASPGHIAAAIAAVVLAAGAVVVLYLYDPTTNGFYPVCLLHQTTGLLCPGCGTLRALHQLTHGNFAAAWGFNPLVVSLLPVGLWLAVRELVRLTTGRRLPGVVTRPIFGWALLAGLVIFGILRNVPISRLLAMSR